MAWALLVWYFEGQLQVGTLGSLSETRSDELTESHFASFCSYDALEIGVPCEFCPTVGLLCHFAPGSGIPLSSGVLCLLGRASAQRQSVEPQGQSDSNRSLGSCKNILDVFFKGLLVNKWLTKNEGIEC